jgi:ATP-binding protein involved in chromosome partitioning
MTGLSGVKPEQNAEGKIIPLKKILSSPPPSGGSHSGKDPLVKPKDDEISMSIMSIGFMIGEDNPLIWRGPMVQSAFVQMLQDVAWEGLDTLVIDMPPGTGDIQLTMSQRVPLTGAVIVSTPQDIALIDARKAIEMFKKVNVPILGLIENMSHYCCPQCGYKDDIFGHGGAKAEAEKLDILFLGEIPLNAEIRQAADKGEPITEFYKEIVLSLREA